VKSFVLTSVAEQDINDLWEQIADDSPGAVDRAIRQLEVAIERLAKRLV